jgi:hypothetical protein
MFGEIATLLPDVLDFSKRWLLPALTVAAAIRTLISLRSRQRV